MLHVTVAKGGGLEGKIGPLLTRSGANQTLVQTTPSAIAKIPHSSLIVVSQYFDDGQIRGIELLDLFRYQKIHTPTWYATKFFSKQHVGFKQFVEYARRVPILYITQDSAQYTLNSRNKQALGRAVSLTEQSHVTDYLLVDGQGYVVEPFRLREPDSLFHQIHDILARAPR